MELTLPASLSRQSRIADSPAEYEVGAPYRLQRIAGGVIGEGARRAAEGDRTQRVGGRGIGVGRDRAIAGFGRSLAVFDRDDDIDGLSHVARFVRPAPKVNLM